MDKAKKGKKQRKVGRNTSYCGAYAASHRRERNKLVRLARHLKRFPGDGVATKAVELCKAIVRGY
jgi:hypothetical protein